MQDRHIGDVQVTRIEEQMGPGFPAKDFFPEFDADTFAAEGHWLAPSYYQPESGRLMTSIHSWLLRTAKHADPGRRLQRQPQTTARHAALRHVEQPVSRAPAARRASSRRRSTS